jgi:D-aspartate ligase
MTTDKRLLPPAIVLGGTCNALSVARSLGRAGVKVYALNHTDSYVFQSRYCTPIRMPKGSDTHAWGEFLLGPESEPFRGAVLLACSDAELEFLARHRPTLTAKYRLDLSDPEAQLCMLNKLSTYRKAEAAGVPLPRFWSPQNRDELASLESQLPFPLVVKPLYSHVYRRHFTRKLVVAKSFEEAAKAFAAARAAGVDVMLVEMIPGPDDRLCSYYTYLDETGTPLFDFTKRIIRRYPPVMGGGCYHVTDWNPEVKELALRLFQAVGLRGLANAEFKRDERDGRLKLIECNARFTEANCLLADSGLDLASFVYNRLTGGPSVPLEHYRRGVRLWYPVEDFRAFHELRRAGQLSWGCWLRGLCHRKRLPFFRWSDPLPSLIHEGRRVKRAILSRLRQLGKVLAVFGRVESGEPASRQAVNAKRG